MAAEIFEWITPAGDLFRLDRFVDKVEVVESVAGRFMPPVRRTNETVPLQAGQRLRSVFHDQREVTLGLYFADLGPGQLRDTVRTWLARFDPTRGDGHLRVTDPNGNIRQLTCRYQEGLELTEDQSTRDPSGGQLAVVTFAAPDPYWTDPAPVVVSWQTGTPKTFFPFFPLHLGSSQVFASALITPTSDVETFPVWSIAGPGSDLVLTNLTTGRTLAWAGTLGLGELLTIDTRPGNQSLAPKSIALQDGSNQFGLLTAWDFWPLVPGTNQLTIRMTGATGDSNVTISYQSRFLSA